jgi:hypothetical protein
MPPMANQVLDREIAAFTADQANLERQHRGQWVIYHDGSLVGAFDSFEAAAEDAVRRFGRGPYLIRQVGAPDVTLPASLTFDLQ